MVKHSIEISDTSNLKLKILKSQNNLNNVSEVIDKILTELNVVIE